MGKAKHYKWLELKPFRIMQDGDICSDRRGGDIIGRIVRFKRRHILVFYISDECKGIRLFKRIHYIPAYFCIGNYPIKFYRKVPVVAKQEVITGKPTASVIGINEEKNFQQESQEGLAQNPNPHNPVNPVNESEVIGECSTEGRLDSQPLITSLECRSPSEHMNFRTGIAQSCKKLKQYFQFLFW
jgi:hypothetical protein